VDFQPDLRFKAIPLKCLGHDVQGVAADDIDVLITMHNTGDCVMPPFNHWCYMLPGISIHSIPLTGTKHKLPTEHIDVVLAVHDSRSLTLV
jgi:hypothetical protein